MSKYYVVPTPYSSIGDYKTHNACRTDKLSPSTVDSTILVEYTHIWRNSYTQACTRKLTLVPPDTPTLRMDKLRTRLSTRHTKALKSIDFLFNHVEIQRRKREKREKVGRDKAGRTRVRVVRALFIVDEWFACWFREKWRSFLKNVQACAERRGEAWADRHASKILRRAWRGEQTVVTFNHADVVFASMNSNSRIHKLCILCSYVYQPIT